MAAHLRVYPGTKDACFEGEPATVRVTLREVLPLIALAQRNKYLWLQDFLDDEICVTPDLYDVLRAFRSYRPSA